MMSFWEIFRIVGIIMLFVTGIIPFLISASIVNQNPTINSTTVVVSNGTNLIIGSQAPIWFSILEDPVYGTIMFLITLVISAVLYYFQNQS